MGRVKHVLGTLNSYGCYEIDDLITIPDNTRDIIANLPELIMFARYYKNVDLEQKLLKIELGVNYFNELQQLILEKTAQQVQTLLDSLNELGNLGLSCQTDLTDEQFGRATAQARQLIQNIKMIFPHSISRRCPGGSQFKSSN